MLCGAAASRALSEPLAAGVGALRRHVELLREYARRAFEAGDPAFLGEVAGKLRLLVLGTGTQRPLLLHLLDEFEMDIEVSVRPPFGPSTLCLDDYLDSLAFAGQTSAGYVRLSHSDVIAAGAQQAGAAHEDWELEEPFARSAFSGIAVGGRPAGSCNAPLHHQDRLECG